MSRNRKQNYLLQDFGMVSVAVQYDCTVGTIGNVRKTADKKITKEINIGFSCYELKEIPIK